MSYYVEPDYWVAGYAVGDATGGLVFGAGASSATATILNAGNARFQSNAFRASAQASIIAGGSALQTFPGINLNAKSQTIAAGVYRTKGGAIVIAQSDTKVGGRIFWEMTTPATGTWIEIVPQAEGSGQ